ncbi:MAG: Cytochrome c oxidase subunit 6 [Alectoria fallacina]|uniref:Cytochrome c oxidase subunit 6, mitochondrial n=1 Tax=Alectoria fallacina TaxID=1903189 RepID=A0A8H3G4Z9_9LECA|nr:MAG: Cytochrome c oxidase subunit 6 [Alectoria fallacina]
MSSMTLFRLAARTQPSSYLLRSSQPAKRISPRGVYAGSSATVTCTYFSTTVRRAADDSGHHEESFEEFTARYDEHLGTRLSSTCTSSLSAEPKHRGLRQLRRVNWLTGNASRYEKEFDGVQDVFELQRNLNNVFAYDLVPSPSVITAALRAARRVNDFPTAVRVFEGIKAKVENKGQYDEYLRDLEPLREELGIDLKEDLYPEQIYTGGANKA